MKAKVAAGEQPWKEAWENLLRQPYSWLNFQPKPFTHIARGSYGRTASGDRELSDSANAAYSHALQWYITGDKRRAKKASEILDAWSAVLWDFEGNSLARNNRGLGIDGAPAQGKYPRGKRAGALSAGTTREYRTALVDCRVLANSRRGGEHV